MYVTYFLLAVTILISVKAFNDSSLKNKLVLNPYDVIQHKKWYRAFSHAFIHADFMHLAFNMFVLYSFGSLLEQIFFLKFGVKGHFLYGLLYFSAILFSSIYSINKNKNNPYYNSLGASGAVSAVLFAFIILAPKTPLNLIFLPIPGGIPAYIFGPLILLFEYLMAKRGGTGIAHDAHISGALYGIIFMAILDPNLLLEFVKSFSL